LVGFGYGVVRGAPFRWRLPDPACIVRLLDAAKWHRRGSLVVNVLVTGAAGFIGSHIIRKLLADGHRVRAIDNLSTGMFWRVEPLLKDIEWMEADVRDLSTCLKAVDSIECVLHQAAIPSVSRSIKDPIASNDSNVSGTVALLTACRDKGVRRLVFAGSSSAYGSNPMLPKVETMMPMPMSPYAVSKLAAEYYCKAFSLLGYVETVCFRYFNVFGPMQDPYSAYAAVVPKFITLLMAGKPLTVEGDGGHSRDFTYVENVVQANIKAMTAPGVSGELFNIGCGERHDLNVLVQYLGEILGVTPVVEHTPNRPGDVPHSLADISHARALLGYEPTVGFRAGLEKTADWFRKS